jgi:hypothetical protein
MPIGRITSKWPASASIPAALSDATRLSTKKLK